MYNTNLFEIRYLNWDVASNCQSDFCTLSIKSSMTAMRCLGLALLFRVGVCFLVLALICFGLGLDLSLGLETWCLASIMVVHSIDISFYVMSVSLSDDCIKYIIVYCCRKNISLSQGFKTISRPYINVSICSYKLRCSIFTKCQN